MPGTASTKTKSSSAASKSAANKRRKATPQEAAFNSKLKDQSSLRFISAKVCEIVESKVTTTYNEVANELVIEALKLFQGCSHPEKKKKDHEKNIRRRVYDALNVLLATDIISKTKEKGDREKSIHWKGYPSITSTDLVMLQKEKEAALAEVEKKKECLQELLVQNVCFRNLERRNKRLRLDDKINDEDEKIALPFLVVNTAENAVIQCDMNHDKTDVMFDFNLPFEINDDNEILKSLGLSQASYEDLEKMLPKEIFHYCRDHRLLDAVIARPSYPPPYPYAHAPRGHNAHGHGHGYDAPPPSMRGAPTSDPSGSGNDSGDRGRDRNRERDRDSKASPQTQSSARPYPSQQPRY